MHFPLVMAGCSARSGSRWLPRVVAAALLVVTLDTFALGLGGGAALYDAQSGGLPSDVSWGWSYASTDPGVTPGVTGGALMLDTSVAAQAGYNLYNGANLDSTLGFTLDFSLRIASESHAANPDRSGFSIIVLDQAARGVELSFRTDRVWVKNADSLFSQGEGVDVNTTAVERTYRLNILGDSYSLATDGAATLIGGLRRYHADSALVNFLVYDRQNYIFFGDNTSSAGAGIALSVINLAPVPEPSTWAMILTGLGCVGAAIRRRRGGKLIERNPRRITGEASHVLSRLTERNR